MKWFVVTHMFREGGKIVAGPFDTHALAISARTKIENDTGNLTYWIDSK